MLPYNQYIVPFILKNKKQIIDGLISAASSNPFKLATDVLQLARPRLSFSCSASCLASGPANGAAKQPVANSAISFTGLLAQYTPLMLTQPLKPP